MPDSPYRSGDTGTTFVVLIYVLHNVLLYFGENIKVDLFCITSIRIFPHSDEVED